MTQNTIDIFRRASGRPGIGPCFLSFLSAFFLAIPGSVFILRSSIRLFAPTAKGAWERASEPAHFVHTGMEWKEGSLHLG